MIITIVSPIRFKTEIDLMYNMLSKVGHIVLLSVCDEGDHETLMSLHRKKIDMCDRVVVLNKEGYMGHGTYEEIGYATIKRKPIEYLVTYGYLPAIGLPYEDKVQ